MKAQTLKNVTRVLFLAGTRPEVIKLAPVILAAKDMFGTRTHARLCLTGQHSTMADEALAIFGISGDYNLSIMTENQSPNDISRSVFERLPRVLHEFGPDVLVVQGDTTSAAAAALCAFNLGIPVAHVEAGLRSHNLAAPFPEELNRKIIASTARFNFCPTESSRQNLIHESVDPKSLFVTGNTIVDALRVISESHDLSRLNAVGPGIRKPFVLVTAHRRESFGKGIENICNALKQCARQFPKHQFVYPVHLNPNIDGPVRTHLADVPNIVLLKPVSYLNLLRLMMNCELVISDSGGIQEEAPSFAKYCIVLREVTERRESVDLGLSELVGTDPLRIVDAISKKLGGNSLCPSVPNPYGDGHAAEKILEQLSTIGATR